jgi:bifunctional non-homologous end joining protein LigD
MALGFPVLPMKATMGSTGAVPEGDDWAFEIKWDGYRTIVHVADGAVRLQSSAGHDVTARWPEFDDLAESVNASSAILDGELVVFDDDGRPRFDLVQRSGVGSDREAVLQFFDVLQIDGTDTIDLPYLDRRRLLERLVEAGDNWLVPSFRVGDGSALVAATAEQGLEGVIAKRVDSRYRTGTRTKDWRKIKNRTVVELTIGGFTTGTGNRAGTFGALLVGRPAPDGLDVRRRRRHGLRSTHAACTHRSTPFDLAVDRCPFDPPPPAPVARTATWVEPVLRATLEIAEFTNDGLVRHATFVDLTE